jgi:hypothetical protein
MGFVFLAIYLPSARGLGRDEGLRGGSAAARECTRYGFAPGQNPVCLNVESSTFQGNVQGCLAYIESWLASVRTVGYVPVLYGNAATLRAAAALATPPENIWAGIPRVAGKPGHPIIGWPPTPDVSHIQGMPDDLCPAPHRAWQYAWEIALSEHPGIQWDASIVAEGFPVGSLGGAQPQQTLVEEDMGFALEKTVRPGEAAHFAGCYNGPLANNRARQMFVGLYAASTDGNADPIDVDVVTNGPTGSVGPDGSAQPFHVRVLPSALGPGMDSAVTWIKGNFGVSIYNRADATSHPGAVVYVTLKAEDSTHT